MSIPLATYRLQFRNGMTFDRAVEIVPYLKRLGVSHLYASPIFAATTGSTHGYDVTDHNLIDPAIGGREGFERLSEALRREGLGLILDIVPNHMAASLENPWWRSVIEWGQASPYADHFDIDWRERLTLPILGKPYEEVLASGELAVRHDAENGCLALVYFEQLLPLNPATYGEVLAGIDDPVAAALAECAAAAEPGSADAMHERIRALLSGSAAERRLSERLAELSRDADFVNRVHAGQPWRLMFWKEARRHLSYRRFFEVTGLVGVRVEEPHVFDAVHKLILDLVRSGRVDGLRIDHVDGLADPKSYLDRLRAEAGPDTFIVVEKILEHGETLPEDWPISGTTGYEFIAAIADVLVDAQKLPQLDRIHAEVSGHSVDLEAERHAAKRLMVERNFETELSALVALASELSGAGGTTRPSERELRTAIVELIVNFPVYRTYGDQEGLPERDRTLLERVAEEARSWAKGVAPEAMDVILGLLEGRVPLEARARATLFRTRFQQLTGPIMAKAVEDTLFYRYNRLIALNEVGGDPGAVDGSVERFHCAMAERTRSQLCGLSATATHDTKRGEDARARLYALSEAPQIWGEAVERWRMMHVPWVRRLPDGPAPEPETEWLLYQALAGVWPDKLDLDDTAALEDLRDRFLGYVEKALREAKRRTDWLDHDEVYEEAVHAYAARLLSPHNRAFLEDFAATLAPFVHAGWQNSLAQTLVKLTAPGVPDIYQGTEASDLSLVDPDNRRIPDFETLSRRLDEAVPVEAGAETMPAWDLKQRLIAAGLQLRREHPSLFGEGDYVPLAVSGEWREHVIAFMRRHADDFAITVVPRLTLGRTGAGQVPFADGWGDTRIEPPAEFRDRDLGNVLTGQVFRAGEPILLSALMERLPVALLVEAPGRSMERVGDTRTAFAEHSGASQVLMSHPPADAAGRGSVEGATGMDDRKEDRVRTRAYELWEKEGRPHGKDKEHWVEAEREHSAQQQAGEARPGGQEQQAQAEEETIGTVAEVPVVRRKRAAAPRQTSTRQTSTRRTTKSG